MIFPDFVPAEYHQALTDAMDLYEIDAPNRAFAFLANCAHETAGFTRMVENLNYSPQRLAAVFPRRFTAAETVDFDLDLGLAHTGLRTDRGVRLQCPRRKQRGF